MVQTGESYHVSYVYMNGEECQQICPYRKMLMCTVNSAITITFQVQTETNCCCLHSGNTTRPGIS